MFKPPPVSNHDLLVERSAGAFNATGERALARMRTGESPSFSDVLMRLTAEAPHVAKDGHTDVFAAEPEDPPTFDPDAIETRRDPQAPEGEQTAQELPIIAAESLRKSDQAEVGQPRSESDQERLARSRSKTDLGAARDEASPSILRIQPRERALPIDAPPDSAAAPPQAQSEGDSPSMIGQTPDAPGGALGARNAAAGSTVQVAPPLRTPSTRRNADADRSASQPRVSGIDEPAKIDRPPAAEPTLRSGIDVKPAPSLSPPSPPATSPAPPATVTPMSGSGASATTFLALQPTSAPRAGEAGTAPSPPSPPAAPVHSALQGAGDGFGAQIVRGSLALTRTTGGLLTMRLEPESLGALRIQMSISQGRVAVQFHAETAQARGLLNQHMETLRSAMETQGLKLETVQIHTLSRPSAAGGQETGHQPHQPAGGEQGSRQDAAGQQSRGHADTAEREAQYRQAARRHAQQHREGETWREQWSAASAAATTAGRPDHRASL